MSERRMTIPAPLAPRAEILQDGRHVIAAEHASGRVLVVYDPVHHCGGVYHIAHELWRIQVPVSLGEFLEGLRSAGFTLPDGEDLQRWLDAVAELGGGLH